MITELRSHPRTWVPFSFRYRVAQWRRRAIRHRLAVRLLVCLVVGAAALVLIGLGRAAVRAEAQWGPTVPVVVADVDHPVGSASASGFELARRPDVMVPPDALTELPADGLELALALRAGEVVVERHLLSHRSSVGDLPAGTRAVNVPTGLGVPPVVAGDSVELLVGLESVDALVVVESDDWVTVAIAADDLSTVAAALAAGQLVVALG